MTQRRVGGLFTVLAIAVALSLGAGGRTPAAPSPRDRALLERGRMLVAYGSCNDCHTPGWRESDAFPAARWMTGTAIGFRGPWGTIYPTNVRLRFQQSTESDWLHEIATRAGHPPMKWTDLRALGLDDRRAIYRFIRSLGPAGAPAPRDVPPGREPATPYYDVNPQPAG
ncbi:hypothetical protein [Vulcanimicrobium alpinum]|uniref:hypothetical protein n=1 Tax=Vulcanimicrobium alpinum TaxID=3016050 RepID=UPI00295EA869|nr:hypothetical protein [Vulcanimicrobium alpinum]